MKLDVQNPKYHCFSIFLICFFVDKKNIVLL